MSAIWKRLDAKEEGFTLIELLVVVIIIGILAAIAIPVFLSQRERGWQAELTSGVRNTALEIEAEATQNGGSYPDQAGGDAVVAAFIQDGLGQTGAGDPLTITYAQVGGGTSFTMCGNHTLLTDAADVVGYDSAAGGVQPFGTACP